MEGESSTLRTPYFTPPVGASLLCRSKVLSLVLFRDTIACDWLFAEFKHSLTFSFQWIWSHLLKKSLMKNFIFCTVKSYKMFIFRSECKLHMKLFPFDTQYCPMKFGSWTYDGGALDFREKRPYGDSSIFSPSGEFFIGGMYFLKSVRLRVL